MDFYRIRRKRLDDAKNMTLKIQYLWNNSYLKYILNKYLNAAILNKDYEIEYSSPREVFIRSKNGDSLFRLTIKNEMDVIIEIKADEEEIKIEVFYNEEDNIIKFNKETIVPHKTKSLFESNIERKTYIDNNLRYEYIYTAIEDLAPFDGEYITITETIIDINNHAVRQEMKLTGEKFKKKQVELNYFESKFYYPPAFNNVTSINTNRSIPFVASTRDDYLEFISGDNNLSPIL